MGSTREANEALEDRRGCADSHQVVQHVLSIRPIAESEQGDR